MVSPFPRLSWGGLASLGHSLGPFHVIFFNLFRRSLPCSPKYLEGRYGEVRILRLLGSSCPESSPFSCPYSPECVEGMFSEVVGAVMSPKMCRLADVLAYPKAYAALACEREEECESTHGPQN